MKRFRGSYAARNSEPAADNVLDRNFKVRKPDRVWVGDITFINTRKGVLFLSTIIDLYSRKVVGWSMSDKQNRYLVKDALMMAIESIKTQIGINTSYGPGYSVYVTRLSGDIEST